MRPLVPAQRVWVPPARLVGRVLLALFAGPLTAEDLADRCGVSVDELAAVARHLRWDVVAFHVAETYLLAGLWESHSAVHEARARLLASEEVCRVAA